MKPSTNRQMTDTLETIANTAQQQLDGAFKTMAKSIDAYQARAGALHTAQALARRANAALGQHVDATELPPPPSATPAPRAHRPSATKRRR